MKVHDVQQGTSAWLHLRAGIPTASEFDRILTPTGRVSAQAEAYMLGLLAERMMGHPRKEFISLWMGRGSGLEPDAVSFYELQRDCETQSVGFITNDAGTVGASPDRLVEERGLLEVKCPAEHTHVRYLLYKAVEQTYYPQIQGQLWIAEREWVDILSYHPEMPPALVRVERDDDFIKKLEKAVSTLSEQLEILYSVALANRWVKAESEIVARQMQRSIQRLAPLDELVKQALRSAANSEGGRASGEVSASAADDAR